MTTKKRQTSERGTKKPKLKRETIRDLSARSKARDVKGGVAIGARGAFRTASALTQC